MQTLQQYFRPALVVALAFLVPVILSLFAVSEVYWLFVASEFCIFAIVSISLDLLMGRSGQISLGHSGFFAIGAYAGAILNGWLGLGVLGGALAGAFFAGVAGLILGFPAVRLRGHYLGIVTFGFGIAIDQIALKWTALTGGDQGLHVHAAKLLSISVASPARLYYLSLVALLIVALLVWNLARTRIGRSFAAIKDSEIAAAAMGIPIARTKVLAFVCSAALAGFAGGLYAFLAGFVAPEDFGFDISLLFFAMVVIGGMGSISGAIAGAIVVDFVRNAAATVSGLSLALVGGLIVLIVLFFPKGLAPLLRWGFSYHGAAPTPLERRAPN